MIAAICAAPTRHHRVTGRSNGRPVYLARPRDPLRVAGAIFFVVVCGAKRYWRTRQVEVVPLGQLVNAA